MCFLIGEKLAFKTTKDVKALLGKRVVYLLKYSQLCRAGFITDTQGKNIHIHDDWVHTSYITELVLDEGQYDKKETRQVR